MLIAFFKGDGGGYMIVIMSPTKGEQDILILVWIPFASMLA